MATARNGVSIPHARLDGGWNVLDRTDDGRTTVAVRDDERSGVALTYPGIERGDSGIERVAAVLNLVGEYVLVAASVRSGEALGALLEDRDAEAHVLDRTEYEAMSRRTMRRLLEDETLLVVEPGTPGEHPGTIQLFDDAARARSVWGSEFPDLGDRFFAVGRVLSGVGIDELARRTTAAIER